MVTTNNSPAPKANALQTFANEIERICVEAGVGKLIARLIAGPVARYVLSEYGGERLPKITRIYPVDQIQADVRKGLPLREICKKHRISLRTLYGLADLKY